MTIESLRSTEYNIGAKFTILTLKITENSKEAVYYFPVDSKYIYDQSVNLLATLVNVMHRDNNENLPKNKDELEESLDFILDKLKTTVLENYFVHIKFSCEICHGTGKLNIATCDSCGGKGWKKRDEKTN